MKEWSTLKKVLIVSAVVIFGSAGISAVNTQPKDINANTSNLGSGQSTPTLTPLVPVTTTNDTSNLSNNNTYTNVDGNVVHSPAYSNNGSIPAGASAKCADGSYSFSQHHQGTCSHHGGVVTWY